MSTDKLIYAYQIPDSFFLPHKVIRPFMAKVVYKIVKGRPIIEEVGLSPLCLTHINNVSGLMTRIDGELAGAIAKAKSLNSLNTTIAAALAPHI